MNKINLYKSLTKASFLLAVSALLTVRSDAATITMGTSTPPVGNGVQNLLGATAAANNVGLHITTTIIAGDYIAGDNVCLGQTFTTGTNERL